MASEIVLDLKQKENKLKIYAPWVIGAVLIAVAIFSAGFAVGKYTQVQIPLTEKETATKSATRKNWFVFTSKNFSLEYPKNWEVKVHPQDTLVGAEVVGGGGRVEFWHEVTKVYKFSQDQKDRQSESKTTKLTVDGRSAEVTEYPYKDGDVFIVIEVPKLEKKPKVTFWLNAASSAYKKTVMEIVTTYKSTPVIGEISSLLR